MGRNGNVKYEIKNTSGAVIFATDAASLRDAVAAALSAGADLSLADLRRADLSGANLGGADLSGAGLSGAYLSGANLSGAYLRDAYLINADLRRANLSGANLRDADLGGADLSGANLGGADLSGAGLRDANLSGAIGAEGALNEYRDDIWSILDKSPSEVDGLVALMRAGKIDGQLYEGPCACLVGSIANVRGCRIIDLGIETEPSRPAEQWFLSIRPGQTPENSHTARTALGWIQEWQERQVATATESGDADGV